MSTEMAAWSPEGTSADTTVSAKTLSRITDSVPINTRKAYTADWRQFAQWCEDSGRTALPCTPETLAEYASFMVDHSKAPSTIMRAVSAIRVIHELGGHHPPRTLAARAVVRDYRSNRAEAGVPNERQAAALTVRQLKAIVEVLDADTPAGLRDRVLLVLGWAMMARRGELVRLNIADIREVESGLEVMIRKSKADQMAAGRKVAVPYGSDPLTCPVRLTRAWLQLLASRGITSGPLLRRINKATKGGDAGIEGDPAWEWRRSIGRPGDPDGRLTGAAVWQIVKRAAKKAGLDASAIQAHSLRAGGATGAYLGGADLLSISRHGGWTDGSAVMTRYIRDVDAWKKNPMHGAGL